MEATVPTRRGACGFGYIIDVQSSCRQDRAPLIDPATVVPLPALDPEPLADGDFKGLRAKQADAREANRKEWDCR